MQASGGTCHAARPAVLAYDATAEFPTAERCRITELSNSAADAELSVALARVAPGVITRWHRLHDTAERYVIMSGHGIVEVGDAPPTPVGPRDVVLIPPGCRQRITNSGSIDLVFLALCTPRFEPRAYEDVDPDPRK